jgi:hypothetical protein
MDATKRKKIIITILIVIIVLVALFLAFRLTDFGQKKTEKDPGDLPVFKPESANLQYKEVEPLVSNEELGAIQAAMNFAERFGTYSSDLPGENIKQLLGQCTKKMTAYLQKMEINYQANEFVGVTTKSISNKVSDISDDQAEIIVQTQRQETKSVAGKLVTNTVYKEIKVNLIKSDKQWLIDAAYWQ